MKLLARILSHGFAIAVVLLLAIGLIYRGELFPEYDLQRFLDIGKLSDHEPASAARPSSEADRGTVPDQPVVAASPAEAGAGSSDVMTPASSPEHAAAEPEVDVREPAAPPAMQEETADSTAKDATVDAGASLPVERGQQQVEEPPEAVPPPVEASDQATVNDLAVPEADAESPAAPEATPESGADSGTVVPQATVAAASGSGEKAYQLLASAREAYWLRDYEKAESDYRNLIKLEPDNPDGYGELGNMYFSQGQWDEAATAYYEAGQRLIGQGLLDQAEELVAVIRGLNGARADELEQKITAARSTTNHSQEVNQ
jgi:hypothetical protein